MPSFYESLSMVTLEAWALGRPVLANARCDVLQGQCRRSNGGLFYATYGEFREALMLLLGSDAAAGRPGRERPGLLRGQLHLGHHRVQISRHFGRSGSGGRWTSISSRRP